MSKLKIARPRHYLMRTTDRTGWCGAYTPYKVDSSRFTFSLSQVTCSLCVQKLTLAKVTKRLKE